MTKSTRFTSFFTSPVAKLQPELAGEVCVAYFNLAAEYEHLRKWTEAYSQLAREAKDRGLIFQAS